MDAATLDARLAAAVPVREADLLPLPDAIVDEITSTDVRRPRRRRRVLVAALAALVLVPATAAAIEVAGVHTGLFPSDGDTESTPGEEYLEIGSPAILPVVRHLTASVPLPPGAGWAPFMERWPAPQPSLMQSSGIGYEVEAYARCRWMGAWLDAHGAGDTAAAARAAHVLTRSTRWRYSLATARGAVDPDLRRVARAARAGDPGPVRQMYAANC
jgi:hypothetical protein